MFLDEKIQSLYTYISMNNKVLFFLILTYFIKCYFDTISNVLVLLAQYVAT